MRITHVFDSVIPQLGKGNRKFQISKVAKGARFKDYAACIDWLCYAGIINRYYCLHFPEPPLKGNYEINAYKLYFADTGLLISAIPEKPVAIPCDPFRIFVRSSVSKHLVEQDL